MVDNHLVRGGDMLNLGGRIDNWLEDALARRAISIVSPGSFSIVRQDRY
jgi:hypothetical protein